jgi:glycosyltransferase involved in cell wall biosynthesis
MKAFALEFATNDDVCLVLKTYMNKAIKGAPKNELDNFRKMIEKINSGLFHGTKKFIPKFKTVIINDILSKKQLNSIYKVSDAFVLPTRGEGFCLPVAEAISYNVPAIVPDIGGHLGYMDSSHETNPFLIESRTEPCENMKNPLWSSINTEWVEPSVSSTRKKIRLAYENRDLCKKVGIEQNKTMRDYLSKERCINLLREHIL